MKNRRHSGWPRYLDGGDPLAIKLVNWTVWLFLLGALLAHFTET